MDAMDAMETSNPVVAEEKGDAAEEVNDVMREGVSREDVEAAIAGAADKQALLLLDRYYSAELRKVQETLQLGGGGVAAVEQVFARLTEAPTNW